MATMRFKGLDEYSAKLAQLSALAEEQVLGPAIYDGAAIVADAVRAELEAVPVGTREKGGGKMAGPAQEVKDAILQGMGVAPLQRDKSFLNVKVGFDGYDTQRTRKYPNGHPIPMLARAVQSGTSFMDAHPFVKNALRKSRRAAEDAMRKRAESEINKIMK